MSMINYHPQSFNNPVGFLSMRPIYAKTVDYEQYNFAELTQNHIEKIYKINNTFLAHRERLLSALFPNAVKINDFTYGDNTFRLCIKQYGIYEVGYWEYCGIKINMPYSWHAETEYTTSSDIISLVATYYNYTFIEAIELIY